MINPDDLALTLIKESNNANSRLEVRILLQQLQEAVQISSDLHCFVGPIMKLLPNHNFEIKKSVYSLLPRVCSIHPDVALLAANTIVKDCGDPNPNVKCIALSVACSLPQILEHTNAAILQSFDDGNPKVRHAVVLGCGKIFKKAPDPVKEMGYIDRLYECVRDSDPVIVTSSLLTLDMILASEGGVVVNRNMVNYLIRRLPEFPDIQLADILQVLRKYTPSNEEELFQEMSVLDPYLTYTSNAAVTVSCINLFLFLIEKDYSYLMNDIIYRSTPVLQEFLKPTVSRIFVAIVLDFFLSMIQQKKYDWLNAMTESVEYFFVNEKDDYKIVKKKFAVLPYVCSEENFETTLQTLQANCLNGKNSQESIICLSIIARRLSVNVGHECLKIFNELLDSKNNAICDHVLNVLQNIDLHSYDKNNVGNLLYKIFTNVHLIRNPTTVPALSVLLGDFGDLVDSHSPCILESMIQNFELHENENTKILILMTSIKMFLKMPAKCQHLLGEVLEKCLSRNKDEKGPPDELYNKARKYYLLLQHDVRLLRKILFDS